MIEKEILSDNTNITANSKQLEILKLHFPSCFDKNGAFIPHKMAEIVGVDDLDLSRESYSLNWLGKSYARLLANESPQTLIKEDKAHNALDENRNSQNLLIKGDNLEVLKHLKNAYSKDNGQVKMIYIDPPYNTGSDGFVYNDDRKFTPEQLSRLAGIEIEEAQRILEFTASKSNSHSAWLTFMYPRLYVARELLKDDGVIFISIDDNEQAQLKLLCNEVFGEENFAGTICWKKKTNGNNSGSLPPVHDYIIVYGKVLSDNTIIGYPKTDTDYSNPDDHPDGPWTTMDLSANHEGPYFPITNEKTGQTFYPPKGRYWVFNATEVEKRINDGRIIFGKTGKASPVQRVFQKDRMDARRKMETWWDQHGFNSDGTEELSALLGPKVFVHSKPTKLLIKLMEGCIDKNDTVMDFFAGSGTTAHAVMELNRDGGNRRYITVQIDEPTNPDSEAYKAKYKSIFNITKTRIEKAAAKIKLEKPDYQGDLGFKVFETIPLFDGYLDEMESLDDGLELYDGSKLNENELGYLLTTWKTYDGVALTEDLNSIKFAGYQAYTYTKSVYFMNKGFSTEALSAFIKALDEDPTFQPSKLVLFGYNFQSKFQRMITEGLKSYKNKKSIELDVVVRY